MNASIAGDRNIRSVLTAIGSGTEHLSARVRKKIAGFERIIAGFRQRRWS